MAENQRLRAYTLLFFILACSVAAVLCVAGCRRGTPGATNTAANAESSDAVAAPSPLPGDEELISVVNEYARTFANKDLKGHINTLHPESPSYENSMRISRLAFEMYDISINVLSVKVLNKSPDEAKLEVTQTARLSSKSGVHDNKTTSLFMLRKFGNQWKVYGTELENEDLREE